MRTRESAPRGTPTKSVLCTQGEEECARQQDPACLKLHLFQHGCCGWRLPLQSRDPHHRPSSPLHVFEDVALVIFQGQLEGQRGVVALQHRCVIVEHGQLVPRVAEERAGPPRVVHVVNGGGDEGGNLVYPI